MVFSVQSQYSERTSESADQTSTSLITSSIHPSTGIADDSGLGESIRPLATTKSCQDLITINFSVHALHFPRSQSWPEIHLLGLSNTMNHDEDAEDDDLAVEEHHVDGDLFADQNAIITRTRSCGALPDDLADLFADIPIRRTNSFPNWSMIEGNSGDNNVDIQPLTDDHHPILEGKIEGRVTTVKLESTELVSSWRFHFSSELTRL